jgi:2-polyprenyl-3-methyl-5-hydroxy-6-metoxy-1,4-benzoquinol methylase
LSLRVRAPLGLLFLLCFFAAWSPAWHQQTVESNEKRIAALSPAERAYERFRFWRTQLPEDQRVPDLLPRYRAYLKQRRFSPSEIDEQLKLVESQGQRAEVDRWNRILTSETPAFNTKPNEFLVEIARNRKPGTALDVGMGQGRNAIWLAQQGWDVTGFDPAEKAVALAQNTAARLGVKIHTEIKGTETFDFGDRRWDLILISYAGGRGMTDQVQRALRPGGILIIESFHHDATKGTSIGEGVVFDTGDLPKLFPALRVVRYEEPVVKADFGPGMTRVVRYCGTLPE